MADPTATVVCGACVCVCPCVCGCPACGCWPDGERTQATSPAYIASGHHVHEATVRGGLWTARCDWSAGWGVPLIADPEAAVVFVSCPKCRDIRERETPTDFVAEAVSSDAEPTS